MPNFSISPKINFAFRELKKNLIMKFAKEGYVWTPKQNFKHCQVAYKKSGTFNGQPMYQKIVTRDNGTTATGYYTGDYCYGVIEESAAGRIDTSFGAINYDKVTQIDTVAGDYFVRLGHKDNPARHQDTYKTVSDRYFQTRDNQSLFDNLCRTVRGTKPQSA